jgi:hypothetical protein
MSRVNPVEVWFGVRIELISTIEAGAQRTSEDPTIVISRFIYKAFFLVHLLQKVYTYL